MGGVLAGVRVLISGAISRALLRDLAGRIRRRGHSRGEARRQRGSFRGAGRRNWRRRAVSSSQPQQEVPHARSDEAGRTGGDAPPDCDRGRGRRQFAAADLGRDEARLRFAQGDQAGHHPDDGHRVWRAGAMVRPCRLRWCRPGHVGLGVHDGRRRSTLPGRGQLSISGPRYIARSARSPH